MNISEQLISVQNKLHRLRRAGIRYTAFQSHAESYSYELNPPLPLSAVEAFEQKHSVTLPTSYREFLLTVGNGGAGPYYGLFPLTTSIQRYFTEIDPDYLRKPFPLTEALIVFTYCSTGESVAEWAIRREEDERYARYVEERKQQLCSPLYSQGTLELAHYGCGIYFLLVINGPEYGNVWVDDLTNEGGIFPLQVSQTDSGRVDFIAWYSMWLDHNLRALDEKCSFPNYAYWSDYWWIDQWANSPSA